MRPRGVPLWSLDHLPGLLGEAVYHSQHIGLHPVGEAPLQFGFVENIHPNGPQVYAPEVYVLNGADANATYQVVLLLYPFSMSCAGEPVVIPTADSAPMAAAIGRRRPSSGPPTSEPRCGMRPTAFAGR
jgi:hypothetical protein